MSTTDPTPTLAAPDWRELCHLHGTNLSDGDGPDIWNFTADQFAAALRAALRAALAVATTTPSPEPFVVRHYSADERPSIKGNGFDGLEIGEDREEAEEFISWVNARLAATPPAATREAAPLPQQGAEIGDEELIKMARAAGMEVEDTSGERWLWQAWEDEILTFARAVWARAQAATREEGPLPAAPTLRSLLHPHYEPGDGSADGAQLVDGEWWHQIMGCDSLQGVVDNARAVLSCWGGAAVPQQGAEISNEQLLELAAAAIDGYDSIAPGEFEPESDLQLTVAAYGSELIAFARTVLSRCGGGLVPPQGAEISDEELADMAIDAGMDATDGVTALATAPTVPTKHMSAANMYWEGWDYQLLTFARAVWARAQQRATLGTEQEIETEFRLWWKDRHGSAYCGAVPLVACIEWTRHAVSRYARPAIQPVPVSEPVARLMYWNGKGGPAPRITRGARTYEEMPEGQNRYWDEGEPLYLAAAQQEGRP
jgi:hypothetical protein